MSKYVIVKKSNNSNPYSGKEDKDFYTLWFHTKTKYENNEPYMSADLSEQSCKFYAIEKKDVPSMLRQAQRHINKYRKQPIKQTKSGHIFVLKLNSPKLKDIIEYSK